MSQMPSPVNSPDLLSPTGSYALRNLSDYASLRAQNELARSQLNLEKVKINQLAEQFKAEMGQRQSEQAAGQQENEKQRAFAMQQTQQSQQFEGGQRELDRRIQEQQLKQQDDQFIKLREYEIAQSEARTQEALAAATTQSERDAILEEKNRDIQDINARLLAARTALENSSGRFDESKTELMGTLSSMEQAREDATTAMTTSIIRPVQQAVLYAALEAVKNKAPVTGQDMIRVRTPSGEIKVIEPMQRRSDEVVLGPVVNATTMPSKVADQVASTIGGMQGFEGAQQQVRDYVFATLQLADSENDSSAKKMADDALAALLKTGKVDAYQAKQLTMAVAGALSFSPESVTDMQMKQMLADMNRGLLGTAWKGVEGVIGLNNEEDFYKDFVNNNVKQLNERGTRLKGSASSLFASKEIMEPGTLTAVYATALTDGDPDNDGPILAQLQRLRGTPGGRTFLMKVQETASRINRAKGQMLKSQLELDTLPKDLKSREDSRATKLAEINVRSRSDMERVTQKSIKQQRDAIRPRGEK